MDEALAIYENAGWRAYLGDREKLARAFGNSLYLLGAFDGDRLVGFIRCVGDGEHIVYAQDVIVHAEYRRRRIGKELMRRAMEEYRHVRMFTLITDAADEDANAFYRSMGLKSCVENGILGYFR